MKHSSKEKITVLSCILNPQKKNLEAPISESLKKNLPNAKLIKTPRYLQAIFRKKTFVQKTDLKPKKRGFFLFKDAEDHLVLKKEAQRAQKYKNNQQITVFHLKKLMDEKTKNREYLLYRHTKQTSLKNQLQQIGNLIRSHYGDLENLKQKKIQKESFSKEEDLSLDIQYKKQERDPLLNRITDFSKTS